MFALHLLISRVHKINFQSLQVVHNTYDIAYDELLSIHHDISIQHRHLHFLVTKVFKSVIHSLCEIVLRWIFSQDLRKGSTLHLPPAHSTCHGTNYSYSELVFFGITFPEKLRKASPPKNLRKIPSVFMCSL